MQNGKYKIKIEVRDEENNELVIKETWLSSRAMEEDLYKIDKQIMKYDKEHYVKCYQCNRVQHIDELSEPENEEYEDALICQDCLEKIMDGKITLKPLK